MTHSNNLKAPRSASDALDPETTSVTPFDCLIVGGGPAGLTAAIYLARYHLRVVLVDAGAGRALQIPLTHNHAGFPQGISGADLLQRMETQAVKYGATVVSGRMLHIARTDEGFVGRSSDAAEIIAKSVLIATGVTNRRPEMADALHSDALKLGRIRYCPVCDGFEVTGLNVAVFGCGASAVKEAFFLRSFSDHITIITPSADDQFDEAQRSQLADIAVRVVGPAADFRLETDGISLACPGGRILFDTIYPALGSIVHSELAVALGVDVTSDGCIKVDAHQRTNVVSVYAAGDIVIGLDQISNAMGQAGVAATTIRNDLAAKAPLLWGCHA